jgi:integrase
MIEAHAPEYLRNIVRIISETGLRVYKELMPMKKEQLDIANAMVWIPDSKTRNGVAEVPLTPLALEAFRDQMRLSPCVFTVPERSEPERTSKDSEDHLGSHVAASQGTIFSYLRSSLDLRHAAQRRRRSGRVGHANAAPGRRASLQEVFADKIAMKREALAKLNRRANEMPVEEAPASEAGDHRENRS